MFKFLLLLLTFHLPQANPAIARSIEDFRIGEVHSGTQNPIKSDYHRRMQKYGGKLFVTDAADGSRLSIFVRKNGKISVNP